MKALRTQWMICGLYHLILPFGAGFVEGSSLHARSCLMQ